MDIAFAAKDVISPLKRDTAVEFIEGLVAAGTPRPSWREAALAAGIHKMNYFYALQHLGLADDNGAAAKRAARPDSATSKARVFIESLVADDAPRHTWLSRAVAAGHPRWAFIHALRSMGLGGDNGSAAKRSKRLASKVAGRTTK